MNHFYISSFSGNSGISKYSSVFYEKVLRPRGFIFVDSSENLTTIFTQISSVDQVHIEIGIFQKSEIRILLLMLKANYKNVTITLHDAPLLKYPFLEFKSHFLNKFSKFYDRYISKFQNSRLLMSQIRRVYILTEKGLSASDRIYKTGNFHLLPHIVDVYPKKQSDEGPNRNFLYLGFIGRNKGLEYALKLHERLIRKHPDIWFYVVGTALGRQKDYYQYLQRRYTRNVDFLGYVHEEDLAPVYRKTRFAFQLFSDYRFFYPASGSILNCMNQAKVVLTNQVNAISEIITDGKNGIFLDKNLKKDTRKINALFENTGFQDSLTENARDYLKKEHNKIKVERHFFFEEKNQSMLIAVDK